MGIVAVVGSVAVLVNGGLGGAPAEQPPDGIIEPGSCVAVLDNTDVREVQCVDGARVVASLVPLGGGCPANTDRHRDRLGLGVACLEPVAVIEGRDR